MLPFIKKLLTVVCNDKPLITENLEDNAMYYRTVKTVFLLSLFFIVVGGLSSSQAIELVNKTSSPLTIVIKYGFFKSHQGVKSPKESEKPTIIGTLTVPKGKTETFDVVANITPEMKVAHYALYVTAKLEGNINSADCDPPLLNGNSPGPNYDGWLKDINQKKFLFEPFKELHMQGVKCVGK